MGTMQFAAPMPCLFAAPANQLGNFGLHLPHSTLALFCREDILSRPPPTSSG